APARARLAMAVLSAVVLLVQISATRLLSATVAYHGAFAVLALVMLALAGSATAVYRDRSRAGKSVALDLEPAARMAALAGALIASTSHTRTRAFAATGLLVAVALLVIFEPALVRLRSAKSESQSSVKFEKWNPLARVTVSPEMPGTLATIDLLSAKQSPEQ